MFLRKTDSYLGLHNNTKIDLDVFLFNVNYHLGGWTKDNGKCSFFQEFHYTVLL